MRKEAILVCAILIIYRIVVPFVKTFHFDRFVQIYMW